MKTSFTLTILVAALGLGTMARAAHGPLELVLTNENSSFATATNISLEIVFRNVGSTNMSPFNLLMGLSVVWDGAQYKRDPKRVFSYNGPLLQTGAGWRERFSLSEFLIPTERLVPGRHTIAVRDAGVESNALTISVRSKG
jgi:hypothetical protein